EKSLDQVLIMEASLRLVEHDEAYLERLGIVNFAKSMDLRCMRTTRDSRE
ncbi:hypothetical protein A2U01_0088607, partial [Trifolium medium]|nr:hypothetical protein [Trifolium medium]